MKSKLTLLIGILLIMSIFVSCTAENGASGIVAESGTEAEFILNTSLPDVEQNIMSFKITQPDVTPDSLSAMGAKLGFMGNAGPTDPGMIGMSNPEKQEIFQVRTASGAIEYTCLNEMFPLSPTLPNNEEAVKIATEFLQETGLWYPDLVAEDVVVGGTSGSAPAHLLVRFTRYVNGYPVIGPGNKFAVRIGDNGKVIRLLIRYNELEQDKEVQIITPAAAFDKLKAGDGVFSLPVDCSTVVITDVSIGYYLKEISEKQEYLTPFYIFQGECLDSSGAALEEFTGWVDALSR